MATLFTKPGWKKIFANNAIYKGLVFKIHKEFTQFNVTKKIKNGQRPK